MNHFLQCTCFVFLLLCRDLSVKAFKTTSIAMQSCFSLGTIHLMHFSCFFSLSPSSFTFNLLLCSLHPLSPVSSLFHLLVLALSLSFPADSPRGPTDLILLRRHGCTHIGAQTLFLTLISSISQIHLTL